VIPNEIIFSPQAEKDTEGLPKGDQQCVFETLRKWKSGEVKLDVEKIKSQPSFFRVKFRHLRIIFYPLGHGRVVLLLVLDRKNAYRLLGNLNDKLVTAMRTLKIVSK
jgi:mRNA-degrading endonuclease RelE of RelBE toxin-antitoxin system